MKPIWLFLLVALHPLIIYGFMRALTLAFGQ
jgi:hypothetical protein